MKKIFALLPLIAAIILSGCMLPSTQSPGGPADGWVDGTQAINTDPFNDTAYTYDTAFTEDNTAMPPDTGYIEGRVIEILTSRILLEGIDEYEGSMWYVSTEIEYGTLPDINLGDLVGVVFHGGVLETYPMQIPNVYTIEPLIGVTGTDPCVYIKLATGEGTYLTGTDAQNFIDLYGTLEFTIDGTSECLVDVRYTIYSDREIYIDICFACGTLTSGGKTLHMTDRIQRTLLDLTGIYYSYLKPDADDNTAEIDFDWQAIRTDGAMPHPGPYATVIRSYDELKRYISENNSYFDLSHRETVYADSTIGFLDACKEYDAEFFKSHALVLAVIEEGSGSVRHKVNSVSIASGAMYIDIRSVMPDGVGTDDMAIWHIMIEIDASDAVNFAVVK